MKRYIALLLAGLFYFSTLVQAGELRKLGVNDLSWGNYPATWLSPGKATVTYFPQYFDNDASGWFITNPDTHRIGSPFFTDTGRFGDVVAGGPVVDVRRYIPVALHAGIAACTDNTNLVPYIQAAYDNIPSSGGVRTVVFPAGCYTHKLQGAYLRQSNVKIVLLAGARLMGKGLFTTVAGDGQALLVLKGTAATPIHDIEIVGPGSMEGENIGVYDPNTSYHAIRTPSNGLSCTGADGVSGCAAVYNLKINGVKFKGFLMEAVWGQGYNLEMDGNYFDDLNPLQANAINLSYDNAVYSNNIMVGGRVGIQTNAKKVTIGPANRFIKNTRPMVLGENVGSETNAYNVFGNYIELESRASANQQYGPGEYGIQLDDGIRDALVHGNLIKIKLLNAGHTKAIGIATVAPRGARANINQNTIIIEGGGNGIFGKIDTAYSGSVYDNLYLALKANHVELRTPISTANAAYRFFNFGDNNVRMDIEMMNNTAKGFTEANSDYALDIRQVTAGTGPLDWIIKSFLSYGGYILLGLSNGTQTVFDAGELDNVVFNATSRTIPVPASKTAKGMPGMVSYDNAYKYEAYDKDKWGRIPFDNTAW